MEIGLFAESAGLDDLDETLRRAQRLGITQIELSTGGQTGRPFLDADILLASAGARIDLLRKVDDHGIRLSALNISAFLLHPSHGEEHAELTRKTMRLAGLLELNRVIAQSGNPGDSPGSRSPNWVTYTWPSDLLDTVRRQWEAATALWSELAAYGKEQGVTRIALELHAANLVYNVPTLFRLREEVGEAIGVNFDPSHLIWQGMDVPACIRALGSAIFHVHIKDTAIKRHNQALVGVLDSRPDVDFRERPWHFCAPGLGHDATWWREFFVALNDAGYDDVASIENQDPYLPGMTGVERTTAFLRTVM